MSRRLVITSSAAVLAVYAVGYVRTQAAADRVAAAADQFKASAASPAPAPVQPTVVPVAPSPTTTTASTNSKEDDGSENSGAATSSDDSSEGTEGGNSIGSVGAVATVAPTPIQAPATATSAPAATATTAPTAASAGYRDGTYSGTGTSRHGDISAKVTVKGGKIVSSQITACYTRYPCSRISDLPGEVISQQSTNVDMVSGATDSSEAFLQAVESALQKAMS